VRDLPNVCSAARESCRRAQRIETRKGQPIWLPERRTHRSRVSSSRVRSRLRRRKASRVRISRRRRARRRRRRRTSAFAAGGLRGGSPAAACRLGASAKSQGSPPCARECGARPHHGPSRPNVRRGARAPLGASRAPYTSTRNTPSDGHAAPRGSREPRCKMRQAVG
jgi:hypothetical protein